MYRINPEVPREIQVQRNGKWYKYRVFDTVFAAKQALANLKAKPDKQSTKTIPGYKG